MVWRDVAADEPRIRFDRLGTAMLARRDRVRARLTEATREPRLRPPAVAPRIAVPLRAGHAGARW